VPVFQVGAGAVTACTARHVVYTTGSLASGTYDTKSKQSKQSKPLVIWGKDVQCVPSRPLSDALHVSSCPSASMHLNAAGMSVRICCRCCCCCCWVLPAHLLLLVGAARLDLCLTTTTEAHAAGRRACGAVLCHERDVLGGRHGGAARHLPGMGYVTVTTYAPDLCTLALGCLHFHLSAFARATSLQCNNVFLLWCSCCSMWNHCNRIGCKG